MVKRGNHDQQDPTAGAVPASLCIHDKKRIGAETSDLNPDRHVDGAARSIRNS